MTAAAASGPVPGSISRLRVWLLRAAYLLLAAGLAAVHGPRLLEPAAGFELFEGVTLAMFAAMALLAFIGLFRPLQMLPLLLYEIAWKAIWTLRIALPQVMAGTVQDGTVPTIFACAFVLPIIAFVPWDEVWRRYAAPGDRWTADRTSR